MMTSGDPVMDRIQTEIRTLTRDSGPRAELRRMLATHEARGLHVVFEGR